MKPTDQPTPVVDQVIAEVHRHKRAIMAEHGDDVEELLKDLRNRQKSNPRLVLNRPSAVVRDEPG
jgi:DNA-directed RNA polymerase